MRRILLVTNILYTYVYFTLEVLCKYEAEQTFKPRGTNHLNIWLVSHNIFILITCRMYTRSS